ncbi:unnamed protein product [Prunus armeniaca]|uniref:Aminotransferase-like plant mobile domain-containing protein n=1 Tax=Prunus armeniaca TaxID=36596 RepID=A0A6J5UTY4_PRUAR|nr:unnamed protein product [Prunus armeniaca]
MSNAEGDSRDSHGDVTPSGAQFFFFAFSAHNRDLEDHALFKNVSQITNFPLSYRTSMSPEEVREYNNILVDALNEDEVAFSNEFYDFAPVPATPRNMLLGPYFHCCMPNSVVKVMRPQQKDICLLEKYLNWQGWDQPKLRRGWPTSRPKKCNKWLDRLSSLCNMQWREEGIYNAIMLCKSSLTCDYNLVTVGLCFWSPYTNTMKLRFGMMTPTLLDLATMAGFRPCGGEVSTLSPSKYEVDFGFTKKNKSYKVFMEANAQETGPLTHKEQLFS